MARGKINLMANEFLPSCALGQLRRGGRVEGLDGKSPEVSRKKVEGTRKYASRKGCIVLHDIQPLVYR